VRPFLVLAVACGPARGGRRLCGHKGAECDMALLQPQGAGREPSSLRAKHVVGFDGAWGLRLGSASGGQGLGEHKALKKARNRVDTSCR